MCRDLAPSIEMGDAHGAPLKEGKLPKDNQVLHLGGS